MIEAVGLSKAFVVRRRSPGVLGALRALVAAPVETRWAVRDVSFAVGAGERVGYIGPNGAGKSTTVKMLTGILVPTSGHALVRGLSPAARRREHAANIGVVFGQRTQLWWDLPLEESFALLRAIYRIPADRYRQNLKRFREILELDPFLRTPVRQLSLGERMRGDLAAALLHDPPVIFLDEPTIGLDVVAKERIREFLATVNREQGVTLLLTTHDLGDIEKLCPRVMIIDHGRLLYDGSLAEIRERYGRYRTLVLDLQETLPPADVAAALTGLDQRPMTNDQRAWSTEHGARSAEHESEATVSLVRSERQRHWVRFDRGGVSAAELIAAVSALLPVQDLAIEEPEVEGIIARIYREGMA
jgi:ABC-2 type transport system ATP-binding protein